MDRMVSSSKGLGKLNVGVLTVLLALIVFWAAFAMAVMHLI
jgi:hypothetical protein